MKTAEPLPRVRVTSKISLTVPKHFIARAKRGAKGHALDPNEFLRSGIEGQLNQIAATKRDWGNGA